MHRSISRSRQPQNNENPQLYGEGGEFERVTVVAPCDPATEPSCFWQVRVTLPWKSIMEPEDFEI